MSCVKPIEAFRGSCGSIVFDRRHSLSKVPFQLPCGRCIGCRLERARQWGIRCVHEARMWPHNCFVTLTYDDLNLPEGGSLSLLDVQRFMKRLRKARAPARLRFFAAGEYGEHNRRPHYHMLLFNCHFPDMRLHSEAGGKPLYYSDELSALWQNKGFCSIGELDYESAVYCAKYAMKRLTPGRTEESQERFRDRYQVYDADGVVYDQKPEFAVMSLKPGIGYGYYEKYGQELRDHDDVIINAHGVKPPRYYDVLTERCDADTLERLKRRRKRLAVLNKADNTDERLRVKERLMLIAAEKKERKL